MLGLDIVNHYYRLTISVTTNCLGVCNTLKRIGAGRNRLVCAKRKS